MQTLSQTSIMLDKIKNKYRPMVKWPLGCKKTLLFNFKDFCNKRARAVKARKSLVPNHLSSMKFKTNTKHIDGKKNGI
jgi:hypothetical protein